MSASSAICSVCRSPFKARRSTARFCSSRCRLINHRSPAAKMPPDPLANPLARFLAFQVIPCPRLFRRNVKR